MKNNQKQFTGDMPQSILKQIKSPKPDIEAFKAVIRGQAKPEKVHLCELFADQEIMQWVTENIFRKQWVGISDDIETQKQHLLCEIDYWHKMGYDYIRLTGGCFLTDFGAMLAAEDTSDNLTRDSRKWANMTSGTIETDEDFEKIADYKVQDKDLWMYEFVADNLPTGLGILACPDSGFLEIPMEHLIGYESMAMMSFENTALLEKVFTKVRNVINEIYSKVVQIDGVAGFFQGDDMGFKTSTMFSPDFLKQYSLPGHIEAAKIAHSHDKIYLLHSCGELSEIMDYLIDVVKIDGRHSYEDVIIPVEDFYQRYGSRVAVLGGLDVDILAAASTQQVRSRTQNILEKCCRGGRYAFGSGNTITNYSKIENVLAMFDEVYNFKI